MKTKTCKFDIADTDRQIELPLLSSIYTGKCGSDNAARFIVVNDDLVVVDKVYEGSRYNVGSVLCTSRDFDEFSEAWWIEVDVSGEDETV